MVPKVKVILSLTVCIVFSLSVNKCEFFNYLIAWHQRTGFASVSVFCCSSAQAKDYIKDKQFIDFLRAHYYTGWSAAMLRLHKRWFFGHYSRWRGRVTKAVEKKPLATH